MRVIARWLASVASAGAAAAWMAGCADLGIESKKVDYKSSSRVNVPRLEIPPDLTSPARDDRFVVPDSGGKGSATYSTYSDERKQAAERPGEVLPDTAKMRVERLGDTRWLVVGMPPDKLWGQIKDFWQELGFVLQIDLPEAGVMETDWAENRAKIGNDFLRNWLGKVIDSMYSTAERDKFRTRLEAGSEAETTEIYVSHRGMYEVYVSEGKDQTRWQPRPPEPELEAEMLRRLMVYLGSEEGRAQAELAEAKNRPADRARLEPGLLVLQDSFDRAWRRAGLALDRAGFTVEDRDRSKGLYFVRYVDPESDVQKNDGFLSGLAFWRSSTPEPQTRYRVFLKDDGSRTTVQVLAAEGAADPSDTAKKILEILFEQMK